MTKYILHGGETGRQNEHNKNFYRSWVADFGEDYTPTILLIYFARPRGEWESLENSDRERFAKYTDDREVNFVVASQNSNELRKQIDEADVVYIRGGDPLEVIKVIEPIKDEFHELLDGKIYIGSSAGVMAISQYARSHTTVEWKPGLGLVPVIAFVHYFEKDKASLDTFKEEHQDLDYEYILLPETEFVTREY